jgi:CubicO group peptidase (beta-lactamase class C family)
MPEGHRRCGPIHRKLWRLLQFSRAAESTPLAPATITRSDPGSSPGSLAWAGLANTYFWIDPARDVSGVILMQVLPFADGKCLEAFAGFERGVYAGLDAAQKAA